MIARHLKLKLNKTTSRRLDQMLWNLTSCYNWAIKTVELRKNLGHNYSEFALYNLISGHSKKCGLSSAAMHGVIHQAYGAWQRCWSKQNGKPRLKGAANRLNSILFRNDVKLFQDKNLIRLPTLGKVRYHAFTGSLPEGKVAAQVTLVKKASAWYAVVLFEEAHVQALDQTTSIIGIDTGFKHLAITSDGEKFEHPRELEKSLTQLAKNQRGGSRKRTARIHEKIANQRKDRNHKISHKLVKEHREIYVTKDNLRAQAHKFGKSIASSGIGQLRDFISYKGSSCGRLVKLVDSKNSTLTCSACGALTGPTGLRELNIRHWACEACGASHDRDVNAAINTLNAGVRHTLDSSKISEEL